MEEIASEANVSRATLYRHFANRDEVLTAVVVQVTRERFARIVPLARAQADIGAAIVTFVRLVLDVSHEDPAVAAFFDRENVAFTKGAIVESSVELFEVGAEALALVFAGREAELRRGLSVDDASEWIMRVILSMSTVRGPRRRSKAGLEAYLSQFLLPAIASETT